jgi:hypothetical protein
VSSELLELWPWHCLANGETATELSLGGFELVFQSMLEPMDAVSGFEPLRSTGEHLEGIFMCIPNAPSMWMVTQLCASIRVVEAPLPL